MVEQPSWKSEGLGTKKRVALWLVQEVGAGSVFTKEQLRAAFEGVSQVDRRMRELRDHGWQIDTNREDPALDPSEHRFVSQGVPVWEPGMASRKPAESVGAAQRRAVLVKDNYLCRTCGIGNGEAYGDDHGATSQLDIARRKVLLPEGDIEVQLVTECNRCRTGGRGECDLGAFGSALEQLSPYERKMLFSWMERDARAFNEVEKLWGVYRTMPAAARATAREMSLAHT
ncbi:hypothetical protein [Actinomadura harenae]|uniref:HNH endonuclease n=1 Tax=Actinomadura harenae TaxID=2483351 RepID=A0A3M2LZ90_9ACTN|nr:hypothetical protein [Actinomadura harenae]RMI42597.1 hypothetical protein EBO15_18985 [Actinomadura harenae]